jgi:chromosome partitioning protein
MTLDSASIKRAAFYVEKGGVGKTTSTAHVGVSAHQNYDLDVLLVDLAGTQNDLATQFGMSEEVDDPDAPISAVFGDNWEFIKENVEDLLGQMAFTTNEGPDLIPADRGLTGADNNLANVPTEERFTKLDAFVGNFVAPEYDLVLFDLPGKEDNIALNGLFAASNIVAPLPPGAFERQQLDNLRESLAAIRDTHPVDAHVVLVTPTMVDQTTNISDRFLDELREEFDGMISTPIADTANIRNEQAEGQTVYAVPPDELYETGRRTREAYTELTTDLLGRLEAR